MKRFPVAAESRAGRAFYLKLWPLTRRERLGLGATGIWSDLLGTPVREWEALVRAQELPPEDWVAATAAGGYPVPAHELESPDARALWFDGYIDTYLERDLRTLARIEDLGDFRRLLRAAALRVGTVVNQAEVDFVIEAGRTLLPVEVKATTRPSHRDARHLLTFRAEYGGRVAGGLLLHARDETFWLAEGILAAPWWRVL